MAGASLANRPRHDECPGHAGQLLQGRRMAPYSQGRRMGAAPHRRVCGGCVTGTLPRTHLLKAGQDIREVEELMGHMDVSTS